MKVELFPFQKTALARLRQSVATALGNYRSTHTPQVVSYTAPTGAGKTIVMSALIETVYYGDELYPEQNEAIFIWLSDSPGALPQCSKRSLSHIFQEKVQIKVPWRYRPLQSRFRDLW